MNIKSELYTIDELICDWKQNYEKNEITYNSILKLVMEEKLNLYAHKISWPYEIWTFRSKYIDESVWFKKDDFLSLVESGLFTIYDTNFYSLSNDLDIDIEVNIKILDINDHNNIKVAISNNFLNKHINKFQINNIRALSAPYKTTDIEYLEKKEFSSRHYIAEDFNQRLNKRVKQRFTLMNKKKRALTLKETFTSEEFNNGFNEFIKNHKKQVQIFQSTTVNSSELYIKKNDKIKAENYLNKLKPRRKRRKQGFSPTEINDLIDFIEHCKLSINNFDINSVDSNKRILFNALKIYSGSKNSFNKMVLSTFKSKWKNKHKSIMFHFSTTRKYDEDYFSPLFNEN